MKNVLKAIFVCIAITLASSSTCYAKTDKILTKDNEGKYYCYNIKKLTQDAINNVLGLPSPLFDDYKRKYVIAFHDDKNGFIDEDVVNAAAVQAVLKGSTFDLDTYTESASKEDVIMITQWNDVSLNNAGDVVNAPSETITATVESITVASGSTIVVVTLPEGVDATQYKVTIGGTELTYNEITGKFAGTIPKSYSTVAQAQADLILTDKSSQTGDFDVLDIY